MRDVLAAATQVARSVVGIVTAYDGTPDAAPEPARLPAAIIRLDPDGGTIRLETGLKIWVYPFWVDVLVARGGEARSAQRQVEPILDTLLDAYLAADLAGTVVTGEARWVVSPLAIGSATYIAGSLRLVVERMTEESYWP
jgi:hypothetical protein